MDIIGVGQANKDTDFTQADSNLFAAMITQASVVLQSTLFVERMDRARRQEEDFLRVVSDVSSEIQLGPLLQKIMDAVTRMLNSERSTLFLNDEKTGELYTEVGQGLGASRIRFPNDVGIAGTVFTTRQSMNIPYAYADLRFNPQFDRQTDFFTRSILCVPLINKDGKTLGATQVLNKREQLRMRMKRVCVPLPRKFLLHWRTPSFSRTSKTPRTITNQFLRVCPMVSSPLTKVTKSSLVTRLDVGF